MMAASTDKAQGYAAQYQAYPYHPPPMYPPAPGYAYIPVLPVHAPPGHLPIAPKVGNVAVQWGCGMCPCHIRDDRDRHPETRQSIQHVVFFLNIAGMEKK
jgi:hypothetical protein